MQKPDQTTVNIISISIIVISISVSSILLATDSIHCQSTDEAPLYKLDILA